MNIELAQKTFEQLRRDFPVEDDKKLADNEAATRLLIDAMLKDVLGWPMASIKVEQPGGDGTRVDYILRGHDGRVWMVIEAKKRDVDLVDRQFYARFTPLNLDGPVLQGCLPIIEDQMAQYLGRYNPGYGLVCNGEQWVAFLFHLNPYQHELARSKAVVFRSLEHISQEFERFYGYFGYEDIGRHHLKHFLAPRQNVGFVTQTHRRRIVEAGQETLLLFQEDDLDFYKQLEDALARVFRPIQEDGDALARCFVESRESRDAAQRLSRMTNLLGGSLENAANAYPKKVRGEEEQVTASQAIKELVKSRGFLARIIGEPSAGKTVFLKRLFQIDLKDKNIIPVWLDCAALDVHEPVQLSRVALEHLIQGLFGEEGPEKNQFQQIYGADWGRETRLLSNTDEETTWDRFVTARRQAETDYPLDALCKYVTYAVSNRRLLPCFVVDNFDQLPHPEQVLNWVVALYKRVFALITVTIEDATLWRLTGERKDALQKERPEQFWLHRPKVRAVIENRRDYLKYVLQEGENAGASASVRLGRHGQYRWKVAELDRLVRLVTAVLLDDEKISNWLGEIANFHMDRVLRMCESIVLSPHVKAGDLFASMAAGKSPSRYHVLKALISPKSEQFQGTTDDVVMNIFGLWHGEDWAPLAPARVLALLRAREVADSNSNEPFTGFVPVSEVVRLFEEHLCLEPRMTREVLKKLFTMAMIETFDPSFTELKDHVKIKILPRGKLHLEWALKNETYVRMMAEVDPVVDLDVAAELKSMWRDFLVSIGIPEQNSKQLEYRLVQTYINYLLAQAALLSPVPDIEALAEVLTFESDLAKEWSSRVPSTR